VRQGVASALAIVLLGGAAASGQAPKNDPHAADQLRAAFGRLAGLKSFRMQMQMDPGGQTGSHSKDTLAMAMEVVPPDRIRMTAESDETGMESIVVAGEFRYRLTKMKDQAQPNGGMGIFSILSMALSFALNPVGAAINAASTAAASMMGPALGMPQKGVWQCPPKMGGGAAPQAPTGRAGEEPAVSRLDDATVDGTAAQVFLATQPGQGQGRPFGKMRVYVLKDGGLPRRLEMLDASDKLAMIADYRDYDAPIAIQLPACGQKT